MFKSIFKWRRIGNILIVKVVSRTHPALSLFLSYYKACVEADIWSPHDTLQSAVGDGRHVKQLEGGRLDAGFRPGIHR